MRDDDIRASRGGSINSEEGDGGDDGNGKLEPPADIEDVIQEAKEEGSEEREDAGKVSGEAAEGEGRADGLWDGAQQRTVADAARDQPRGFRTVMNFWSVWLPVLDVNPPPVALPLSRSFPLRPAASRVSDSRGMSVSSRHPCRCHSCELAEFGRASVLMLRALLTDKGGLPVNDMVSFGLMTMMRRRRRGGCLCVWSSDGCRVWGSAADCHDSVTGLGYRV